MKPAAKVLAAPLFASLILLVTTATVAQQTATTKPLQPKSDPYFNANRPPASGTSATSKAAPARVAQLPRIRNTFDHSSGNAPNPKTPTNASNQLRPKKTSPTTSSLPNSQTMRKNSRSPIIEESYVDPNLKSKNSLLKPRSNNRTNTQSQSRQPRTRQPLLQPPKNQGGQPSGVSANAMSSQFEPPSSSNSLQSTQQANFEQPAGGQQEPQNVRQVTAVAPVQEKQKSQLNPITPESVVSDANLSGENRVQKIAEGNGEVFESGTVLAVVGGEPIFAADLTLEANQLIERAMPTAPETVKREQRKIVLGLLLNKYIESKMFYVDIVQGLPEGADVNSIFESLGKSFDEQVLDKILEKNKVKSAKEFDLQLRAQGVSLRHFRKRWIEDEFVRYFLKDKIDINPDVAHQEILDDYRSNKKIYEREARARWEQLEVHFQRVPDRMKAKQMIAKLGNEVVYGAPLKAVAKRSSHGLKASKGGQEGWVTEGSLVSKELDKAIFSLPLNRLSDIIESELGYHIVRVLERQPAGMVPFSEAQVEIKKKLIAKKREQAFRDHLAKLKKKIPVEKFVKTPVPGGNSAPPNTSK